VTPSSVKYRVKASLISGSASWQQTATYRDRHLDASAGEHLAEFAANVAATYHQQRLRQLLEFQRRRAGQIGYAVDPGDRRQCRSSARRDDDFAGLDRFAVKRHAIACQSR